MKNARSYNYSGYNSQIPFPPKSKITLKREADTAKRIRASFQELSEEEKIKLIKKRWKARFSENISMEDIRILVEGIDGPEGFPGCKRTLIIDGKNKTYKYGPLLRIIDYIAGLIAFQKSNANKWGIDIRPPLRIIKEMLWIEKHIEKRKIKYKILLRYFKASESRRDYFMRLLLKTGEYIVRSSDGKKIRFSQTILNKELGRELSQIILEETISGAIFPPDILKEWRNLENQAKSEKMRADITCHEKEYRERNISYRPQRWSLEFIGKSRPDRGKIIRTNDPRKVKLIEEFKRLSISENFLNDYLNKGPDINWKESDIEELETILSATKDERAELLQVELKSTPDILPLDSEGEDMGKMTNEEEDKSIEGYMKQYDSNDSQILDFS